MVKYILSNQNKDNMEEYYLITVTAGQTTTYLYPKSLMTPDLLQDLKTERYIYCGTDLEPTEDGKFIDPDSDEVFTHSGFNEKELIEVGIETKLDNVYIVGRIDQRI